MPKPEQMDLLELGEDGPIAFELPCLSCGYLLKTQKPEGTCPECGTPIHESISDWIKHNRWSNDTILNLRGRILILATCPILLLVAGLGIPVWLFLSLNFSKKLYASAIIRAWLYKTILTLSYFLLAWLFFTIIQYFVPHIFFTYSVSLGLDAIVLGLGTLQITLMQIAGMRLGRWVKSESQLQAMMMTIAGLTPILCMTAIIYSGMLPIISDVLPESITNWLTEEDWVFGTFAFCIGVLHLVAWSCLAEDVSKIPPRPETN